ncbi:MAG: zinc ribbon domain-containing protein [Paludibacteraceae bacterium]|nr:zinc ribbon domain-containing protein [Paludibacteraceae bacterium]
MKCPYCNRRISSNVAFCPKCGRQVVPTEAMPAFQNMVAAKKWLIVSVCVAVIGFILALIAESLVPLALAGIGMAAFVISVIVFMVSQARYARITGEVGLPEYKTGAVVNHREVHPDALPPQWTEAETALFEVFGQNLRELTKQQVCEVADSFGVSADMLIYDINRKSYDYCGLELIHCHNDIYEIDGQVYYLIHPDE